MRQKPPGLSIASYISDLKERFPVPQRSNQETPDGNPWRARVLALEEENEKLRVNVQKRELEIQELNAARSTREDHSLSDVEVESSQSPRKKRRVTPSSPGIHPERLDLSTLIKDIRSVGPRLPALKDSLDILSSFRNIRLLNEGLADESERETILVPNLRRSLVALGELLSAALAQDRSDVAPSLRVDITDSLSDLLVTLFTSTLPLAPHEAVLKHVLGDLTICIIRPIIRAFYTLSVSNLADNTEKDSRKASCADIRSNLLSTVRRLIGCLGAMEAHTRDLREFMVLETVREIETLWGAAALADGECPREQRMHKLARKDSLWYQCSVLHTVLDDFSTTKSSDPREEPILFSKAVQVLGNLMEHIGGSPVNSAARDMVLGVLEKAWLNGFDERPATK